MNLIECNLKSANSQSDLVPILEEIKEMHNAHYSLASTAFQNFDQKANQLYNLMASVMKSIKEMRGALLITFDKYPSEEQVSQHKNPQREPGA